MDKLSIIDSILNNLIKEIRRFFKEKMPFLQLVLGYEFISVKTDNRNEKSISFVKLEPEEKSKQKIRLLSKVLNNGTSFYAFSPDLLEGVLEGEYKKDSYTMPEISDWLGVLGEEFDIYFYQFNKEQFSLGQLSELESDEFPRIYLVDMDNKIYLDWGWNYNKIIASSRYFLEKYLSSIGETE